MNNGSTVGDACAVAKAACGLENYEAVLQQRNSAEDWEDVSAVQASFSQVWWGPGRGQPSGDLNRTGGQLVRPPSPPCAGRGTYLHSPNLKSIGSGSGIRRAENGEKEA